MTDGGWVALFSGGKDSSYALHLALERGLPVERLVTVHPGGDSYMYHVPATRLASLAAESIGLALVEVEPGDLGAADADDAGAQGDREVEPLEAALAELPGDLGGVVAGAVESAYQADRVEAMCDRLGADVFAPLWRREPRELAAEMLDAGLEIRIVQVAAGGLDESWLGRRLDREAVAELAELSASHGVHVLGEGGEYETLVTDGPHMDRAIEIEAEPVWDGTRGHLDVLDARLA